MVQVVRLKAIGGADGLEVADVAPRQPGPGEVAIRQTAIGVNFIDIYQRLGLYPLSLPAILGVEGAGRVTAVGQGVDGFCAGDRIAYAGAPVGAYAAERVIPAWRAIHLPAAIPDEVAAAGFIRGLTAHMLLTATYRVVPGTTILVHAAAGGLGSLLVRWGKRLGATVIGTVGSDAKAGVARAGGRLRPRHCRPRCGLRGRRRCRDRRPGGGRGIRRHRRTNASEDHRLCQAVRNGGQHRPGRRAHSAPVGRRARPEEVDRPGPAKRHGLLRGPDNISAGDVRTAGDDAGRLVTCHRKQVPAC